MTAFFVFNPSQRINENIETRVLEYLKGFIQVKTKQVFEGVNIFFASDEEDATFENTGLWGEIVSLSGKKINSLKEVYSSLDKCFRESNFQNISDVDGSWGFLKVHKDKLLVSKGAYNSSSVAPDLYYRSSGGVTYFSTDIKLLIPLLESTRLHLGSALSGVRFGAPSPGNTLFEEIKRIETGYIYEITTNGLKVYKNIFDFKNNVWWDRYSKADVPLDEAIRDLESVCLNNIESILPANSKPAVTLSGGIDSSSSAISISQASFKNDWIGLYGSVHGEDFQKGGDKLSESQASKEIARKLGADHASVNMMDYVSADTYSEFCSTAFTGHCWGTAIGYRALALAAKERGRDSIVLGSGEDLAPASYIFQENVLHDFLNNENKFNWKVLQRLSNFRPYRGVVTRILKRKDLVVPPYGHYTWHHEMIGSILLERFLKGYVSKEHIKNSGEILNPRTDVYGTLPVKEVWPYVSAINYDRLFPDLWSGIINYAMLGTGVKAYNVFAGQGFGKYIIALPKRYKTGEGFPIEYNNPTWNKFLFRKLVDKHVGPDVAWRSRYGFANPLWHSLREPMKMDQVVGDVQIFDNKEIQKRILATHPRKHILTVFTLAKTKERAESTPKIKIL
jgi:hypothetical protein